MTFSLFFLRLLCVFTPIVWRTFLEYSLVKKLFFFWSFIIKLEIKEGKIFSFLQCFPLRINTVFHFIWHTSKEPPIRFSSADFYLFIECPTMCIPFSLHTCPGQSHPLYLDSFWIHASRSSLSALTQMDISNLLHIIHLSVGTSSTITRMMASSIWTELEHGLGEGGG